MKRLMMNLALIIALFMVSTCSVAAEDELFSKFENPPAEISDISQSIDVMDQIQDGILTVEVPAGQHIVHVGLTQEGFSQVYLGSPGAKGPALDHYKAGDEMNFILGVNHSLLHGFVYSPPEEGPYGRVQYGSYFSDENTWWPYIRKVTDYNTRLSCDANSIVVGRAEVPQGRRQGSGGRGQGRGIGPTGCRAHHEATASRGALHRERGHAVSRCANEAVHLRQPVRPRTLAAL